MRRPTFQAPTPKEDTTSPRGSPFKVVAYLAVVLACAALIYQALARPHSSASPSAPAQRRTQSVGPQAGGPVAATSGAQESLSLTPAVVMKQVAPGQSAEQTLAIENQTSKEFTFEVVALDLVVRDGQAAFVPPGPLLDGIAGTASFSQKYFNVKPWQTASITVTFTVPPQTTARGVLIMLQGTDRVSVGGELAMTTSLGALITVTTPPVSLAGTGASNTTSQSAPISLAISQWVNHANPETREDGVAPSEKETRDGRASLPDQARGGPQP
jgi:hypothetical protein